MIGMDIHITQTPVNVTEMQLICTLDLGERKQKLLICFSLDRSTEHTVSIMNRRKLGVYLCIPYNEDKSERLLTYHK